MGRNGKGNLVLLDWKAARLFQADHRPIIVQGLKRYPATYPRAKRLHLSILPVVAVGKDEQSEATSITPLDRNHDFCLPKQE